MQDSQSTFQQALLASLSKADQRSEIFNPQRANSNIDKVIYVCLKAAASPVP
jgi:hypothetical protein